MPLMHYRFPYVGADLRKLAHQPGISKHCKTTDTGWFITQYASLVPRLSSGTHSSLTTEGGLRLSRPVCLVLHQGGLPVQRWSPTQALTGPSVEYGNYVDWVQRATATLSWQPVHGISILNTTV